MLRTADSIRAGVAQIRADEVNYAWTLTPFGQFGLLAYPPQNLRIP